MADLPDHSQGATVREIAECLRIEANSDGADANLLRGTAECLLSLLAERDRWRSDCLTAEFEQAELDWKFCRIEAERDRLRTLVGHAADALDFQAELLPTLLNVSRHSVPLYEGLRPRLRAALADAPSCPSSPLTPEETP